AGRRSRTGCTRPRSRTGTACVPSGRSRCPYALLPLGPPPAGRGGKPMQRLQAGAREALVSGRGHHVHLPVVEGEVCPWILGHSPCIAEDRVDVRPRGAVVVVLRSVVTRLARR